ncbi:hypothetical protein EV177_009509, partial [Coemansia sp. RSA 1804]
LPQRGHQTPVCAHAQRCVVCRCSASKTRLSVQPQQQPDAGAQKPLPSARRLQAAEAPSPDRSASASACESLHVADGHAQCSSRAAQASSAPVCSL